MCTASPALSATAVKTRTASARTSTPTPSPGMRATCSARILLELRHQPAEHERGEDEGAEHLQAELQPLPRRLPLQEGEDERHERGERDQRKEVARHHDLRPTATS